MKRTFKPSADEINFSKAVKKLPRIPKKSPSQASSPEWEDSDDKAGKVSHGHTENGDEVTTRLRFGARYRMAKRADGKRRKGHQRMIDTIPVSENDIVAIVKPCSICNDKSCEYVNVRPSFGKIGMISRHLIDDRRPAKYRCGLSFDCRDLEFENKSHFDNHVVKAHLLNEYVMPTLSNVSSGSMIPCSYTSCRFKAKSKEILGRHLVGGITYGTKNVNHALPSKLVIQMLTDRVFLLQKRLAKGSQHGQIDVSMEKSEAIHDCIDIEDFDKLRKDYKNTKDYCNKLKNEINRIKKENLSQKSMYSDLILKADEEPHQKTECTTRLEEFTSKKERDSMDSAKTDKISSDAETLRAEVENLRKKYLAAQKNADDARETIVELEMAASQQEEERCLLETCFKENAEQTNILEEKLSKTELQLENAKEDLIALKKENVIKEETLITLQKQMKEREVQSMKSQTEKEELEEKMKKLKIILDQRNKDIDSLL